MINIAKFSFYNVTSASNWIKNWDCRAFYKKFFVLGFLFFIPLYSLHTEESAKKYLIYLKTAGLTRTGADQRLNNLLAEAAEFDLQQRGFTTLTEEEWQKTHTNSETPGIEIPPPPDIFAQLSIKAFYEDNDKDLTILFDWHSNSNGTYAKSSRLNDNLLYLDKLISDTITEITVRLGIKVPPPTRKAPLQTGTRENIEAEPIISRQQDEKIATPSDPGVKSPDESHQYTTNGSLLPDKRVQQETQREITPGLPIPTDKESKKIFELALGVSPFVPAGETTRVTQIGFFSSCTASFLLNLNFQTELAFGLYGAFNYFKTSETVVTVPIMYIPIGIDLRFIIHGYLPFSFYFRASGGPAVNRLLFSEGPVNRLTAYALGGIGVTFTFRSLLALGIDSNYIVFFETPVAVMGFHPSAVIYYRF